MALGSGSDLPRQTKEKGMVKKTKHHDMEKLKDVIDGMDTAMFTTVAGDGRLASRPLRMQEIDEDGAMWFVTDRGSHKAEEIQANPQVNVSFAAPSDNTYVSISGRAAVLFDKARLQRAVQMLWDEYSGLIEKGAKGKKGKALSAINELNTLANME
jgi:general stress protein 26